MARQSKTKAETEPVQNVTAPVVEATKAKKVKVTSTTKVNESVVSEVTATPVVVKNVEDVQLISECEVEVSVVEQSLEYLAKLQQASVLLSSLKNDFKVIEKRWNREIKIAQKQSSKRKRKAGNRAPSGFVKPTRISDELAKFLDKPVGSEMARTEVTREINKYIIAHKLQDEENGRKINADSKLTTLLKLEKTDELTYFNLQKYMSCHFAKATKKVATA
jgi:chromatin remodeling complex protein RSC6